MSEMGLHAFVDEAGQRARSEKSSAHFVMSAVIVSNEHLGDTLRYLLERLSWLARDQRRVLGYTLSHIARFKIAKLRAYEDLLHRSPDVRVAWDWLDPKGGRIDQPSRLELLQLADSAASATFAAFECDTFGNTESRYLVEMSSRLYRRPGGKLTSYGLKMHPWSENARVAYPWVATL